MALDYNNPNDWGKSPLTDNALRIQQFRAENPEAWEQMIDNDLEALTVSEPIVIPAPLVNDWDSIGYPEGQILPYCDGDADLCGDLSAIYHLGGEFPSTGNGTLDSICNSLTQTEGYGAYSDYGIDFE